VRIAGSVPVIPIAPSERGSSVTIDLRLVILFRILLPN